MNAKPTEDAAAQQPTRIVRDVTCPECGNPKTYAEVRLDAETASMDRYGCAACGWRLTPSDSPQFVYYEPEHDETTRHRLEMGMARRGYVLTDDEDAAKLLAIYDYGDDGLDIMWGDLGAGLERLEAYPTVTEYVDAVCDWFESDCDNVPAAPGAALAAARAAKIASLRSLLEILEADAEIPLPRLLGRPIAFDVPDAARAERIVSRLANTHDEPDRPKCLDLNRAVHGTIGAVDVVVYTRVSSEVTR
jgi:rubredoxin